MTTNTEEFNHSLPQRVIQLVADYGVDVITPINLDGVGQVGELRIATGVREPAISKSGKQIHRSIYADAIFNEGNLFQKHRNKEVFFAKKSSNSLKKNKISIQHLETITKSNADIDEAIKNKYVLRLFYTDPDEFKEDFDRVFYFLDENLDFEDMLPTLAKTLFGKQLTGDEKHLDDSELPF